MFKFLNSVCISYQYLSSLNLKYFRIDNSGYILLFEVSTDEHKIRQFLLNAPLTSNEDVNDGEGDKLEGRRSCFRR